MTRVVQAFALPIMIAATCLLTAAPAHACSCAGPSGTELETAVRTLATVDAAFVGIYEGRDDPDGAGPLVSGGRTVTNHFGVEHSFNEDLGSRVDVDAPADGASCGLELAPGERTGLYLTRQADRWTSGLCATVDADVLLAAANARETLASTGGAGVGSPRIVVASALTLGVAAMAFRRLQRMS